MAFTSSYRQTLLSTYSLNGIYCWCNSMHFINWQRDITIEEFQGRKVVIKRNKSTRIFHEYLLCVTYSLISILLAHPSSPPSFGFTTIENESLRMRSRLNNLGIKTPDLISLSESSLVEEFIEKGDLYRTFSTGNL